MVFSEKYSFTVKEGVDTRRYSFDVKDGKPNKIGDGSYGIVFKVFSENDNSEYAAKVFYNSKDSKINNMEESRIQSEINARKELFNRQKTKEGKSQEGIIKSFGGCDDFTSDKHPAYNEFKDFFQELNISNFVAISEWYNKGTLKDLLVKEHNLFSIKRTEKNNSEYLAWKKKYEDKLFSSQKESKDWIDKNLGKDAYLPYQLTGYEILRKLPFVSRIQTILPFMLALARGIEILHSLGLRHLDIKTSNIFVKHLDGDTRFDVVLGDLGFLVSAAKPDPNKRPTEQTEIPLGTLHYRSPEQKDYYDICDVEIRKSGFVIVRDPKFKDSIIERGDIIVFSKTNKIYKIAEIDFHPTQEAENVTKIKIDSYEENRPVAPEINNKLENSPEEIEDLFKPGINNKSEESPEEIEHLFEPDTNNKSEESPEEIEHLFEPEINNKSEESPEEIEDLPESDTNNKSEEFPEPDINTQAYFYKQPEIKTDIFGIGALAYDMITCGHSPERFYDSLRLLDERSNDNSVDKILDKYNQVASLRSTDNNAIDAFKYFQFAKNSTTYAPYDFVKIILKCMLYKTKGTYYNVENNPDNVKNNPVKILVNDLKELAKKYSISPLPEENKLIHPESLIDYNSDLGKKDNKKLSDILKDISDLESKYYYERLIKGFWCIENLTNRIQRDTIDRPNEDYLKFLSPEDIIYDTEFNNEHNFKLPVSIYKQKKQLLEDVRQDYLHTKIDKNISKYFIPDYFYFLRRQINLKPTITDLNTKYNYKFLDVSLCGNTVNNGDFIVCKPNSNDEKENIILKIYDLDMESRTLSLGYIPGYKKDDIKINEIIQTNEAEKEFIYYQNIEPSRYYLLMLGKFFYQVFFDDTGGENSLQPIISHVLECTFSSLHQHKNQEIEFELPSLKPYFQINIQSAQNKAKKKIKTQLIDLICSLLEMYVLLSVPLLKNSFYKKGEYDNFTNFKVSLAELKNKIVKFISSSISSNSDASILTEKMTSINPSLHNQDVKQKLGLNDTAHLDSLGEICDEVFNTIDINKIYRESIVCTLKETYRVGLFSKKEKIRLFNF